MYREDQDESGASFVLGMLTGAFIGAGVALLFAPRTGTEMRQQIGEQYRGLADRVGETTQSLRESAQTLREQGRERVQQVGERVQQAASQLSDRVSSAGSSGSSGDQTPAADRFPSSAPSV